jgi:hypothetical protein
MKILTLLMLAVLLNSCKTIAVIFETGMGIGMFTILAILVIVAFIFMKTKRK